MDTTTFQETSVLSLIATDTCDYVIRNDGSQVKIGELKGKTLGILFSANRSEPCRNFMELLLPVYKELKDKGANFEILFISDDQNEKEFTASHSKMPWLAVPFSNRQSESLLADRLKVTRIPSFVIVGPDGKSILSRQGRSPVIRYGAKAFPFTEAHLSILEKKQAQKAAKLPRELNHPRHEHTLVLTDDAYRNSGMFACDLCKKEGNGWVYHCAKCSYDLHPTCAEPSFDLRVDEVPAKEIVAVAEEVGKQKVTEAEQAVKGKRIAAEEAAKEKKTEAEQAVKGKRIAAEEAAKEKKTEAEELVKTKKTRGKVHHREPTDTPGVPKATKKSTRVHGWLVHMLILLKAFLSPYTRRVRPIGDKGGKSPIQLQVRQGSKTSSSNNPHL